MTWLELSVKAPPEFAEPLSQIFYRYGHGGVAIESEGGYNPDEGEAPPEPDWVTICLRWKAMQMSKCRPELSQARYLG